MLSRGSSIPPFAAWLKGRKTPAVSRCRSSPRALTWNGSFRSGPAVVAVVIGLVTLAGCRRVVVLDERFYDSRLDNWTVIDDPDTLEGPSRWRVESDGWLHQSSNIWGRRGDFIGRWYGTFLVAGERDWKDYTLTVRAKPADNDGFGVVFRFRDPEHFYRLLLIEDGMSGGPLTRLDKRNGPDYTEIWSAKRGYRVGTETDMRVSMTGDNIRVDLDGSDLLDVNDGSFRSGKIGLFCFAQSGQAFTDVRVVLK
jgi:hypothetical protein